jgi:hypothetical protein
MADWPQDNLAVDGYTQVFVEILGSALYEARM